MPESCNHYQQRLLHHVYPENLFTDLKLMLLTLFEAENIYSCPLYRSEFIFEDLISHSSLIISSLSVFPPTRSLTCCSLCYSKLVDIFF